MERPTPDGSFVVKYMEPIYSDSENKMILQPKTAVFLFSEGWTRKEDYHGLKAWKLKEFRPEGERHFTQTFPWHIVLKIEVTCNSDEYQEKYEQWLEHDHKLGHPAGKPSFQCSGCFEEEMARAPSSHGSWSSAFIRRPGR